MGNAQKPSLSNAKSPEIIEQYHHHVKLAQLNQALDFFLDSQYKTNTGVKYAGFEDVFGQLFDDCEQHFPIFCLAGESTECDCNAVFLLCAVLNGSSLRARLKFLFDMKTQKVKQTIKVNQMQQVMQDVLRVLQRVFQLIEANEFSLNTHIFKLCCAFKDEALEAVKGERLPDDATEEDVLFSFDELFEFCNGTKEILQYFEAIDQVFVDLHEREERQRKLVAIGSQSPHGKDDDAKQKSQECSSRIALRSPKESSDDKYIPESIAKLAIEMGISSPTREQTTEALESQGWRASYRNEYIERRHPLWSFSIVDMMNHTWLEKIPQVKADDTIFDAIEHLVLRDMHGVPVFGTSSDASESRRIGGTENRYQSIENASSRKSLQSQHSSQAQLGASASTATNMAGLSENVSYMSPSPSQGLSSTQQLPTQFSSKTLSSERQSGASLTVNQQQSSSRKVSTKIQFVGVADWMCVAAWLVKSYDAFIPVDTLIREREYALSVWQKHHVLSAAMDNDDEVSYGNIIAETKRLEEEERRLAAEKAAAEDPFAAFEVAEKERIQREMEAKSAAMRASLIPSAPLFSAEDDKEFYRMMGILTPSDQGSARADGENVLENQLATMGMSAAERDELRRKREEKEAASAEAAAEAARIAAEEAEAERKMAIRQAWADIAQSVTTSSLQDARMNWCKLLNDHKSVYKNLYEEVEAERSLAMEAQQAIDDAINDDESGEQKTVTDAADPATDLPRIENGHKGGKVRPPNATQESTHVTEAESVLGNVIPSHSPRPPSTGPRPSGVSPRVGSGLDDLSSVRRHESVNNVQVKSLHGKNDTPARANSESCLLTPDLAMYDLILQVARGVRVIPVAENPMNMTPKILISDMDLVCFLNKSHELLGKLKCQPISKSSLLRKPLCFDMDNDTLLSALYTMVHRNVDGAIITDAHGLVAGRMHVQTLRYLWLEWKRGELAKPKVSKYAAEKVTDEETEVIPECMEDFLAYLRKAQIDKEGKTMHSKSGSASNSSLKDKISSYSTRQDSSKSGDPSQNNVFATLLLKLKDCEMYGIECRPFKATIGIEDDIDDESDVGQPVGEAKNEDGVEGDDHGNDCDDDDVDDDDSSDEDADAHHIETNSVGTSARGSQGGSRVLSRRQSATSTRRSSAQPSPDRSRMQSRQASVANIQGTGTMSAQASVRSISSISRDPNGQTGLGSGLGSKLSLMDRLTSRSSRSVGMGMGTLVEEELSEEQLREKSRKRRAKKRREKKALIRRNLEAWFRDMGAVLVDDTIGTAIAAMAATRTTRAVVVSPRGQLLGTVCIADICRELISQEGLSRAAKAIALQHKPSKLPDSARKNHHHPMLKICN